VAPKASQRQWEGGNLDLHWAPAATTGWRRGASATRQSQPVADLRQGSLSPVEHLKRRERRLRREPGDFGNGLLGANAVVQNAGRAESGAGKQKKQKGAGIRIRGPPPRV